MSVKEPSPLSRPPVWSLSGSTTTVDAVSHYAGAEIPITNTAGDLIAGLKKRQAEITMSVRINTSLSPFQTAVNYINRTNSETWANGGPRTWLCTGGSAQQATELVGNEVVDYWQTTYSFAYRPEGWVIRTPNVGLFELVNGNKQRIVVSDADGNDVPAAKPQPLNPDGSAKTGNANADILTFVVYGSVDFGTAIGNPPS